MLKVFAVFALLLPVQNAIAQSFVCTSDMSVGFFFNEEKRAWDNATFQNISTYDVRRVTDKERAYYASLEKAPTWGVFKPGQSSSIHLCKEVSTVNTSTKLLCGDLTYNFKFDERSLRFQAYYVGGYSNGVDNNEDTPYIQIGRCHYVRP